MIGEPDVLGSICSDCIEDCLPVRVPTWTRGSFLEWYRVVLPFVVGAAEVSARAFTYY